MRRLKISNIEDLSGFATRHRRQAPQPLLKDFRKGHQLISGGRPSCTARALQGTNRDRSSLGVVRGNVLLFHGLSPLSIFQDATVVLRVGKGKDIVPL
jgi:hypothetical protein